MRDPNGLEYRSTDLLDGFLGRCAELSIAPQSRIEIEHWAAPHQPKSLRVGFGAVYVFVVADHKENGLNARGRVIKVGKVGPKSNARYQSQHYGFSARSTVAGALVANPIIWPILGISSLDEYTVSAWLKTNTERWNYLVPEADAHLIGYLENYLKAALGPALEGVMTREMAL